MTPLMRAVRMYQMVYGQKTWTQDEALREFWKQNTAIVEGWMRLALNTNRQLQRMRDIARSEEH